MMKLKNHIAKYFEDIDIERKVITSGKYNEEIVNWLHHITIKGRLRKLSGNEIVRSDQLQSIGTHRLYCYPADIVKETDRIVFNGKNYEIIDVNNVMNFDDLLQIECEEQQ